MTDLIRWEPDGHGGYLGHAGETLLWHISDYGAEWLLRPSVRAACLGAPRYATGPDGLSELKAAAEVMLREFAASIGAVFPDEGRWQALRDWLDGQAEAQRAEAAEPGADAEDVAVAGAAEWAVLSVLRKMTELEGK